MTADDISKNGVTETIDSSQGSLSGRLVRTALLWLLPVLLVTAAALTLFYRASTYKIFDDPLDSAMQALIAATEVSEGGEIALTAEPTDARYQLALSGRYWLIGSLQGSGAIETLIGSPSLYGATLAISSGNAERLKAQQGEILRIGSIGPDRETLRAAVQLVRFDRMDEPLVIVAAADKRAADRAVRQFAVLALSVLALLAAGLVAAIAMQVRSGLQPLFRLRSQVAAVRAGRTDAVAGEFPSEIQPLADELNTLFAHNRRVVETARSHVANLAHALKTPIAVLSNETAGKTGELAVLAARQTDIMSQQVDHHLRRARAAARGMAIGARTNVDDVVEMMVRTMPRIHRGKDLDIVLERSEGLVFRGEKRDLEEMIGNLIDNACKWCAGEVAITVRRFGLHKMQIHIDDDGPGLPPEKYDDVLKRGLRLDETTPGSGFGLAIVNDLAQAYRGSLILNKSPKGGLRTTLDLPLIDDEDIER